MIRVGQDGKGREVVATGIRNSVGHDFHPETGELWFTDNQVDGMGDDIPPGEINRMTAVGQAFGHPWYGGGDVRTNEFKDQEPPGRHRHAGGRDRGARRRPRHASSTAASMFPEEYRNAIFSAQHGSWNRTVPVGARVMVTTLGADGTPDSRPFAEGWLDETTGEYSGRPVDVAELRDGSLLVSDDLAGALYRIWYEAPGG